MYGTVPLVLLVLSITDERNKISPGLIPLSIGFTVAGSLMAFAFNCGAAINPARDFGPRIFTSMIYGKEGQISQFNSHAVGMTAVQPYGLEIDFVRSPSFESAVSFLFIILKVNF